MCWVTPTSIPTEALSVIVTDVPLTSPPARRASATFLIGTAVLLNGVLAATPAHAETAVGTCYDYDRADVAKGSSSAPAVSCDTKHTAETYFVGKLPESFGLPSKVSVAQRISAGRPCTVTAMNAYLGTPERRLPSRFQTVVLVPTDEQWRAGDREVRCDVVLQGGTSLVTLTKPAAEMVASTSPEQFDFCTPGTPNAKNTAAFPCNKPKVNWIKVLDKELGTAGSPFPGTKTVENRTRSLCKAQGKTWNGKEKYPGWWAIWPTAKGWKEGRRSAQCFVPYLQYQAELAQGTPASAPAPESPAPEEPARPAGP